MTEVALAPADESRYVADLITCHKCLDVMNDPVRTPCAHQFCRGCAEGMIKDTSDCLGDKKTFECFECDFKIDMNSILHFEEGKPVAGNLVADYKTNSVISVLKGQEKRPFEYCERCRQNESVIVCVQCDEKCNRLCTSCNIKTHRGKTKDHTAATFLSTVPDEFKKWEESAKTSVEKIKGSIKNIDNCVTATRETVKTKKETIATATTETIGAVNTQRQEQLDLARKHKQSQLKAFKDARRELVSGVAVLNKLELDIKRSTSDSSQGKVEFSDLPALKQQFEGRFSDIVKDGNNFISSATGRWEGIPGFTVKEKSGFSHSLLESLKPDSDQFPTVYTLKETSTRWAYQKQLGNDIQQLCTEEQKGKEEETIDKDVAEAAIKQLPAAVGNSVVWKEGEDVKEEISYQNSSLNITEDWSTEGTEGIILQRSGEQSYGDFAFTTTVKDWIIQEEEVIEVTQLDSEYCEPKMDESIEGEDKTVKKIISSITWGDSTIELKCTSRSVIETSEEESRKYLSELSLFIIKAIERKDFTADYDAAVVKMTDDIAGSAKAISNEQQDFCSACGTANEGEVLKIEEKRLFEESQLTKSQWLEAEHTEEEWEAATVVQDTSLAGLADHNSALNAAQEDGKIAAAICIVGCPIRVQIVRLEPEATAADIRTAISEGEVAIPDAHKGTFYYCYYLLSQNTNKISNQTESNQEYKLPSEFIICKADRTAITSYGLLVVFCFDLRMSVTISHKN